MRMVRSRYSWNVTGAVGVLRRQVQARRGSRGPPRPGSRSTRASAVFPAARRYCWARSCTVSIRGPPMSAAAPAAVRSTMSSSRRGNVAGVDRLDARPRPGASSPAAWPAARSRSTTRSWNWRRALHRPRQPTALDDALDAELVAVVLQSGSCRRRRSRRRSGAANRRAVRCRSAGRVPCTSSAGCRPLVAQCTIASTISHGVGHLGPGQQVRSHPLHTWPDQLGVRAHDD